MAERDFTQVGSRFNRLEVVGPAFRSEKNKRWYVPCRCICGEQKSFLCKNLISGRAISCGCARREPNPKRGNFKHHAYGSPTYRSYWAMLTRCYNPNSEGYKGYGGRGIQVCDRWRSGFEAFLADMGERPVDCTLDRVDTNGNYEPANCRWANDEQQRNNKRGSIILEHLGKRLTVAQWAAETGIPSSAIRARLSLGWAVNRALTEPSVPGRNQFGRGQVIAFNGKSLTWAEWASEVEISYFTLKKRMENGWTLARTLTQPLESHRKT